MQRRMFDAYQKRVLINKFYFHEKYYFYLKSIYIFGKNLIKKKKIFFANIVVVFFARNETGFR